MIQPTRTPVPRTLLAAASAVWMACAAKVPAAAPAAAPASAVAAVAAVGAVEAPIDRPLLLWQVRKGEAVSYLLGTCHLSIPLSHALPPPYDAALRGSRVLVNELDLGAAMDPSQLLPMFYRPDADLRAQLGDHAFAVLSWRIQLVPAPMLVHMPAWLASALATVTISPPDAPNSGVPVMDLAVAAAAAESGVRQVPLETPEQQIATLEALEEVNLDGLRAWLDREIQVSDGPSPLRGCVTGEPADLDALFAAVTTNPRWSSALLEARNRLWADRIVDEATRGGAFVAVGAGHMIGQTGLVATLRGAGFDVTQLRTEAPPTADPIVVDAPRSAIPYTADPARVSVWLTLFRARLGRLCAEDQPLRCFVPEAEACKARLADGLRLCLEQVAPLLPDPTAPPPEALARQVTACAIAAPAIEAVALGVFGEGPVCEAQRARVLQR